MITGDGAYIKKINRSLILRKIIEHGLVSRADLSKITGLNKATISVQVADLLADELIYETDQKHTTVGRRPILLSLNKKAGYVLGIDLDYGTIQYTVSDLLGNPLIIETITLDIDDYEAITDILIKDIKQYTAKYADNRYGLVGAVIGIHGTVNKHSESALFVPRYQWYNKSIKTDIEKELDIPIIIENNANLSAYAEKVYYQHDSTNLLTVILSSGIGLGIINDGQLQRGYHGYAGEMGHMIVAPNGEKCKCGNKGCWELYSAESSLINKLSSLKNKSIDYDLIEQFIHENDKETRVEIEDFINYLSIGINNIINLFNPETLVLTSEILTMLPHAIEEIESKLNSSVSQYEKIVLSKFGNHSCGMGACALAIQHFLEVPELILPPPHIPKENTHHSSNK